MVNEKREKKATRSSRYQFLLVESACSSEMMEAFRNEDSISSRLNPYQYDEKLLDLQEELKKEFWRVVNTLLTDRQRDVIKLYADGYTQMEIAKILGINQSSITKNWNGNLSYDLDANGNTVKTSYGGSKKKIGKIIEDDPKITEILQKINEVRQEKW